MAGHAVAECSVGGDGPQSPWAFEGTQGMDRICSRALFLSSVKGSTRLALIPVQGGKCTEMQDKAVQSELEPTRVNSP